MKRVLFGVILLAVLLILGFLSQSYMVRTHRSAAGLLELSSREALADNWDGARVHFCRSKAVWDEAYNLSAALADHDPMEEVEGLYAQLEIFAQQEETTHFAALCMETSTRLQAIADAHVPSLWNIF